MPSFENLILGAPIGFVHGCAALSKLSAEEINHVVESVARTTSSSSMACRAASYIIQSSQSSTPKPSPNEIATVLDANTVLSREIIAIIVGACEPSPEAVTELPRADELVDFKWRLGVAISSSTCKNLSSPYVSITFAVKDKNGNKVYKSAELSYKEFQEFSDTFREVARVMDDI